MAVQERDKDKTHALAELRKLCPQGTTVYVIRRRVNRLGDAHDLSLYVIHDSRLVYITGHAALVLGLRMARGTNALTVRGGGMDMGFAVVSDLSYAIHGRADDPRWKGKVFKHLPDEIRPGYTLQREWL